MKIAQQPTKWVMIQANRVMQLSHWYFIILHIDKGFIEKCHKRMKKLEELAKDENFYRISFWESPHGWYRTTTAIASVMDQIIDDEQGWAYVTIDNIEDLAEMALSEQELSLVHFDIGTDGYASFTGIGKKHNSRFFSFEIPLYTILNQQSM